MHSHREPSTPVPDPIPVYDHHWRKTARAGFEIEVAWRCLGRGRAIEGQVRDLRGSALMPFALSLDGHTRTVLVLTHSTQPQANETFVDVTLQLQRRDDLVLLDCNLPISDSEYYNGPIGQWQLLAPPTPGPSPAPDPGDEDDISILAPMDAGDLFPFVWMQPLTPRQLDEIPLRFVHCANPSSLPLYQQLLQAGSAAAKIADAQTFHAGSGFVKDLSALGPTVARMPGVCRQFLDLTGRIEPLELTELAELELGLPPGTSLEEYLHGSEWEAALSALWQSVFAIALAGTPADAAITARMCATLRLGQFLTLVTQDAVTTPALDTEAARHLALHARLVVPDAVATQPPSPSLHGGTESASWEVLGIGQLKLARHRLVGYSAGELADVVNVMPRERQEVQEHSLTHASAHEQARSTGEREHEQRRQRSDSSELADAVAEVMAADGLARNLSKVTPSYENLNMSLSGTWAGSAANAAWNRKDQTSLVQRITERAVHRLNDRVSQRRGLEWQALREQRRSQLIDNSGHGRLVGLYHWIDRVVRVRLEPLGGRLVLEFLLSDPAGPWLQQLCDASHPPLQKPPSLPAPQSQQPPYSIVTADNYQELGASYGLLDLEPPPPQQLAVSATIDQITLGDLSRLRIPDGYQAASGSATLAVADSRYALACSIGGIDLPATKAAAEPQLSASVPACTSSSAGPVVIAPPSPVAPLLQTSALSGIAKATGAVPVTVITAAPAFAVTVQLQCELAGTLETNPLYVAWQMRVYARLLEAWREADARYALALSERIHVAAPHPGDLQRKLLRQGCLDALAPAPQTDGHSQRDYAALFGWAHMTWQYMQHPTDGGQSWPEPAPSAHLRPRVEDGLDDFLHASAARVLLPVLPGSEAWLLWLLQFPIPWAGGPADVPATAGTVALLEELQPTPETIAEPVPCWTLRVPTTLLYLQSGSRLPPPLLDVTPAIVTEEIADAS